ncbi:chemotaxis protein CheD [Scatolibacter rhodanostii]|uniref:chemotaxis protein CheD n=1 Tax=Scatolibacter rhodanostii TaxID=2014781 RepID=UPI000C077FDD|nr:chemotaxis protein CheD [Scatolibacter rhodanostii]
MSNMITVGISDLNVAKNGDVLVTYALGSCIGICLYDSVRKVAGLSHIMLPSSVGFHPTGNQIYKFADLAIPILVDKMKAMGAKQICLRAKIAGGAQMFAAVNNSGLANIGQRNIIAVRQELQKLNIPILVEDTGKNYGRTQYFDSADGTMRIKSVNRGEWVY